MSVFDQDDPGFQITLDKGMLVSIISALTLVCVIIFVLGIVVGRNTYNPEDKASTASIDNKTKPSPVTPSQDKENKISTSDTKTDNKSVSTPREMLPTPTQKLIQESSFAVQVAFVSKKSSAEDIKTKLNKLGYFNAFISILEGDITGYRVRVGPYKTRSESTEVWRKLKRQGYPKAWIVVN
ncbi:MAG: hypothetical protein A2161_08875 [Candidatus Schekmanbacteria bacterium RBG_13_48_7]|uniref:SPOR domain-containing protein n=1 Tax=Candidatus Schekmanbacteria bacterium RBG_13_48_7 TaxID=1817878 RepID=A0A1F7RM56_9BACT|nr:MAG: hypothetical protein A2161_08875 [Candidatus Schekmanbacteria bacterium RBG_13_48_7]